MRSAELKQQQEVQHYRRMHEGSNESLRLLTQENVSIKAQLLDLQTRLAESAALLQHLQANKGAAFEKLQNDLANATRMIRTLEQVCFLCITFPLPSPSRRYFRTSNHCKRNFLRSVLSEHPLPSASFNLSGPRKEWYVFYAF